MRNGVVFQERYPSRARTYRTTAEAFHNVDRVEYASSVQRFKRDSDPDAMVCKVCIGILCVLAVLMVAGVV